MSSNIRIHNFIQAAQLADSNNPLVMDSSGRVKCVHSSSIEENRSSWRYLITSLNQILGVNKVASIFYRYGLSVDGIVQSGKPLLPTDIELCGVGSSRIFTKDLKKAGEKLKSISSQELQKRWSLANPFPVNSCKFPLLPAKWINHNPLFMDQDAQNLLFDMHTLSFESWLERFSKCVVSYELEEKQLIPAPGINGQTAFYKVHQKIIGYGLVAYALKPVGKNTLLKPYIVFRPTQTNLSRLDAVETYLNDFELHIGRSGYQHNKHKFDQLMTNKKFCSDRNKIGIAGYSLGGVYAQRFLIDYWGKVSEAVFYNDPSVEKDLAELFANTMNAQPPNKAPLKLTIVRVEGDLIHYIGDKHVGWGITHPNVSVRVLKFDRSDRQNTKSQLHATRVFDTVDRDYTMYVIHQPQELRNDLDNARRGNAFAWYQKIHRVWGRVISFFLGGIMLICKGIGAIFKIKILRSGH